MPMEPDTLDFVKRFRGQIALTAMRTADDRNILYDKKFIFPAIASCREVNARILPAANITGHGHNYTSATQK